MRAIFIRHGESTANTGLASADVASIVLTERGAGQAGRIAREWTETPSLIVTSPFQRTRQTAAPTIARFPDVPVERWPIEEFTYLQPARWNGTTTADRRPHVERYWTAADPDYCDGEGAESFGGFLRRVEVTLARLAALPVGSLVYVFGHGQFIQAARAIVTSLDLNDQAQMRIFWGDGAPPDRHQRGTGRVSLAERLLGLCGGMTIATRRDRLEGGQVAIYFAAVIAGALIALAVPDTMSWEAAINPALALMLFVTFLQVPLTELDRAFGRLRFLGSREGRRRWRPQIGHDPRYARYRAQAARGRGYTRQSRETAASRPFNILSTFPGERSAAGMIRPRQQQEVQHGPLDKKFFLCPRRPRR